MGLDGRLFAFPPGRAPRSVGIGRYYRFLEWLENRDADRPWNVEKRAHDFVQMMAEPVRVGEVQHPDDVQIVEFFRQKAQRFLLEKVIHRWGPDCPCRLVNENEYIEWNNPWGPRDAAVQERLIRWRRAVRDREAREGWEKVQQELAEKRRRQWEA